MAKNNKITLSKSSDGSSYCLNIGLSKDIQGTPIQRSSNQGWINFGRRNDYPKCLAELYYNSPTHQACIDFLKTAIVGDGIDYEAMNVDKTAIKPNPNYSWDEFINLVAFDYALYNGFSFLVIKNRDNKTYSFFHQPFDTVRVAQRDDSGKMGYYVCHNWRERGKYVPQYIDAFSFGNNQRVEMGKPYLFYYKDYAPATEGYYPVPQYITALNSIQAESELIRYDLRSIINNFSASGILTLNQIDDDEEKRMLIENIQNLFSGSENANSLIINFKTNGDEVPATFVRIDKDAGNSVNLFEQANERIIQKIIVSHKIPSKALIGYDLDGGSLGGDGNTLNVAYNLFNKTTGNSRRNNVVKTINYAFALNGINAELIIKPLSFSLLTDENNASKNTEG